MRPSRTHTMSWPSRSTRAPLGSNPRKLPGPAKVPRARQRIAAPARKREVGRGERTLPGVWRLRLPLPWPGIPHCNAWAVAAGDGVVLFDTGMHEAGSMAHLDRALDMVGLRVEHVRLVVCTH